MPAGIGSQAEPLGPSKILGTMLRRSRRLDRVAGYAGAGLNVRFLRLEYIV